MHVQYLLNVLITNTRQFNLKELSEIHAGFHSQLRKVVAPGSSARLSEVFLNWREKFLIYGDYCANLTIAQNRIQEICSHNEGINQEVIVSFKFTLFFVGACKNFTQYIEVFFIEYITFPFEWYQLNYKLLHTGCPKPSVEPAWNLCFN